jgi:hypothetical protein
MPSLRVRIVMNRGRVGVPLHKLSEVVEHTERFFRLLAEDVQIQGGEWIGLDFSNGSLAFDAEYVAPVPVDFSQIKDFNSIFDDLHKGKPSAGVRTATRYQYAQVAEQLDDDELIDFGLYKDGAPVFTSLSKRDIPAILGDLQTVVESQGSFQGTIHSLYLASEPPHFFLRELSTETLIKCTYAPERYNDLVDALKVPNTVLHVYGISKINLPARNVEHIRAERIDRAQKMSDKDFEKFFGCAPNLTGELSTQEFIDTVRERDE